MNGVTVGAPSQGLGPAANRTGGGLNEAAAQQRITVDGKHFRAGTAKWFPRGFTYGPFAADSDGNFLPSREQTWRDLTQMAAIGANVLRVYHVPPLWFLDMVTEHGLRVLIDVPWDKHRCFFEDWGAMEQAKRRVEDAARHAGQHSATFAISVVNELPRDVVRFYGHRRVERWIDELLDVAKQHAPECLATFANYPPTEYLMPSREDFVCFNVYLHDRDKLEGYCRRLQHLAGALPLVIGESGMDSFRHGETQQAQLLEQQVKSIFQQGLAGSFVFAFTDDWFTGGHQVEDWAFGVTRRDRSEKPAALALRSVWPAVPRCDIAQLPKVSVVVCSYNGAATLEECLQSLTKLNYPEYEVILVDDGSTDNTPEIASNYPGVHYIRQPNRGLSYARNVGVQRATGEIVAYTDSDCIADEDWLYYLVRTMQAEGVAAIGGPNVPPTSDSWTAKCVAASPGGPSHVMFDDRYSEHVPGCNMAFRRDVLLSLGGFDPQFRQAGDDVDICWRLLDLGMTIGYAPAALVWHHRRSTVRAYLRQQSGYGRSEAMLHFKHPRRFSANGYSRWHGIIYAEGAVPRSVIKPVIYHGRFGLAHYQILYRNNAYSRWSYFNMLEWHALAAFVFTLGVMLPGALVAGAIMELLSVFAALRSASSERLPPGAPLWARPLVFVLHLLQPVFRSWHRYRYRYTHKKLPEVRVSTKLVRAQPHAVRWTYRELHWDSSIGRGREELLTALEAKARKLGWSGDFDGGWHTWDVNLDGDHWHNTRIFTATEELGGQRRFTRARCSLRTSPLTKIATAAAFVWTSVAVCTATWWAAGLGATTLLGLLGAVTVSRRRCFTAATNLLWRAGRNAGLAVRPGQAGDENGKGQLEVAERRVDRASPNDEQGRPISQERRQRKVLRARPR